jgi:hypothetical protein
MRPDARRRLDRLVWLERARIASAVAPGLAALAMLGALCAYAFWPDPVIETRTASGVVTSWTRAQSSRGLTDFYIWAALEDGREITIVQAAPDFPRRGPAQIEERRHRSGRVSFRWIK